MRSTFRTAVLTLGVIIAVVLPLVVADRGVGAAPFDTFEAVAAADGVRVTVDVGAAPLTPRVGDAGAPVAQALVNALGDSIGLASMPYPGDTVVNGPSLVFGLTGAGSPPEYPLIAATRYPSRPEAEVSQPGLELHAVSDRHSTSVSAVSGGGSGTESVGRSTATADAFLDEAGSRVVAEAVASVESFTAGGVVRIGSSRATAAATIDADGEPTLASEFRVDGFTIAGVTAAITAKGIVLPGTVVPVPDTGGENAVLDGAGVTLRYIEPTTTEDTVVSAGLAVTIERDLPSAGRTAITYTFGRARAGAQALPGAAGPTSGTDLGALPRPSPSPTVADEPSSPSPPPSANTTDRGSSLEIGGPAEAPAPTPSARAPDPELAAAASEPTSAASFYLVLVGGAAVTAAALSGLRIFGVRLAWT